MGNSRWIAGLLILLGAASYGMLSPFIKLAYGGGWNDTAISASQLTVGAALMWGIVLFRPGSWSNPFKGPWIRLSMIGIFGMALTTVLYNRALAELDASLAIVMLFQFTWITVMLDAVWNKRRPTVYQWVAIGLTVAGTLLAVNILAADYGRFSWRGLAFGLGSALSYSFFLFFTGRVQSPMHHLMKSAVMVTAAVPAFFVLYKPTVLFHEGNGQLLLWGLLLGLLGQVIPTVCFNIGIPRTGGTLAAMLGSVELPVAVIGAFLLLGESVAGIQWLGMVLILAGVVVSEKKAKERLTEKRE